MAEHEDDAGPSLPNRTLARGPQPKEETTKALDCRLASSIVWLRSQVRGR